MGSGLLQLAVAAALVTGSALFIAEQSQPALYCPPGPSWRQHASLLADMPAAEAAGMDPAALSTVTGMAADAMRRVGWPASTQFARFDPAASLEGVLGRPWAHPGGFLLIVPGNGSITRRLEHVPFLSIHPAAANLTAALAPAAAALNAAAGALEAALGRRLFAFQLAAAALPACTTGAGPCAVWEASSGRVVLDTTLAGRMAALAGGAAVAAAGSDGGSRGSRKGSYRGMPATLAAGSASEGEGSGAGQDLPALLAAFVDKAMEQAAGAAALLQSGTATLPALTGTFARAGASAVVLLMAGPTPLWWCITCPIVLGMLAPFIFNYGLTAAAEALCAQLQLPVDTCNDLWWSAFALALALSLGAAIPIVYICKLPECGRRVGAAAAAGLAAARMAAS
ncbi:hypothetical protein ABPG75_002382 [Micractinium tetrahymenae]